MDKKLSRRNLLQLAATGVTGLTGCISRGWKFEGESNQSEDGVIYEDYSSPGVDPEKDFCQSNPLFEADGELFLSSNFRERRRCAGSQLDNMENLDEWTEIQGDVVPDTDTYFSGNQSARLLASKSTTRVLISRTFSSPLDLSSADLSFAVNPRTARSMKFQLLAPDIENCLNFRYQFGDFTGWFRIDWGPTSVKGSPDLSNVTELRIATWAGRGDTVELNIDDIRTVPKAGSGHVVLTFDDVYQSQYEHGFSSMQKYGFKGVVGTVPAYVGKQDRLSLNQLQEMQSADWDIVSHPQRKKSLPELSPDTQRRAIQGAKQWLYDRGFESGADFLIWPYNEADVTSFDIASKFHCFGFGNGSHPCGTRLTDPLTIPRVDINHMKETKRAIEFAAEYNQIATIMIHSLASDGEGPSPQEFEQFLEYVDSMPVEVVTATEWKEKFFE